MKNILHSLMTMMILIFLGGGCATIQSKELLPILVWPSPPEIPRIEHLAMITKPDDIDVPKSFLKKIWEFLIGPRDEKLIKPYGVTANGKGKVYVTDTALPGVHVLDLVKGKYLQFSDTRRGKLEVPIGIAVDKDANIYVSDSALRQIFIFDEKGHPQGEIGGADLLTRPSGIAIDPLSNLLYVVDTHEHQILFFNLQGDLLGKFGQRGELPGEFNFPTHIFIDHKGFLYITDSLNFRVQIFNRERNFVTTFGKLGDGFGQFSKPKGVAVDREGYIYVVESFYDYVNIYDRQGRYLLSFGGPGPQRGKLWLPGGIYIDQENKIYIADSYNARLQIYRFLGGGEP